MCIRYHYKYLCNKFNGCILVPILVVLCLDLEWRKHKTLVLAGNRSEIMLLLKHSRNQFFGTTLCKKQKIQRLQALALGTFFLKKIVIYCRCQLYTMVCYFLCDTQSLNHILHIQHTCSICEKR